ncbi:hypothetical protein [Pseudobutyrivibrio sp.]|nr:hypothetical protein [Pseudobutyrivibrio sp.]
MIRTIEKSTIVLGKEIKAIIEFTDNGLNGLRAMGALQRVKVPNTPR